MNSTNKFNLPSLFIYLQLLPLCGRIGFYLTFWLGQVRRSSPCFVNFSCASFLSRFLSFSSSSDLFLRPCFLRHTFLHSWTHFLAFMEWADDIGSWPAAWSYVPVQSSSCSLRVFSITFCHWNGPSFNPNLLPPTLCCSTNCCALTVLCTRDVARFEAPRKTTLITYFISHLLYITLTLYHNYFISHFISHLLYITLTLYHTYFISHLLYITLTLYHTYFISHLLLTLYPSLEVTAETQVRGLWRASGAVQSRVLILFRINPLKVLILFRINPLKVLIRSAGVQ